MVSSKTQIFLLVAIARLLHLKVNCSSDIVSEVQARTLDNVVLEVILTSVDLFSLQSVVINPELPDGSVNTPPLFPPDYSFIITLIGLESGAFYDLHIVTDNGSDRHIYLIFYRILQITAATTTQDIAVVIENPREPHGMSFLNLRRDGLTVYTHSNNHFCSETHSASENLHVMDSNGYGLAVTPNELKPATYYTYEADHATCSMFVNAPNVLCTRAASPVDVSVVDSGEETVLMKFKRNPDNVGATNGFRITSSPYADIPQTEDNIEQVEIGNLTSWVVYTFNISQKFNCTGSLQDGESDFDLSSEPVTIVHLVRGYGASSDTSGNTKESCNHVTAIITALSLLCFISAISALAMAVILFVSLRPNNKVTDENFVNLRNARSLTIIDKCHIKIVKKT